MDKRLETTGAFRQSSKAAQSEQPAVEEGALTRIWWQLADGKADLVWGIKHGATYTREWLRLSSIETVRDLIDILQELECAMREQEQLAERA